jgi:hypothetical protein
MQHHNSEASNIQQHHYEDLKSWILISHSTKSYVNTEHNSNITDTVFKMAVLFHTEAANYTRTLHYNQAHISFKIHIFLDCG